MPRTALILSVLFAALPLAQAKAAAAPAQGGTIMLPDALHWAPAQGLPPGAQVAVLYGDPSKKGGFALRFKFPAGYEVATHSHPTDEFLTVISGSARMSFGDKANKGEAQSLPADAFMVLPAGAWHHLWVDADTVIELHSTGPFGVTLAK